MLQKLLLYTNTFSNSTARYRRQFLLMSILLELNSFIGEVPKLCVKIRPDS